MRNAPEVTEVTGVNSEYSYRDARTGWAHTYLLSPIVEIIGGIADGQPTRMLEIGAGNGSIANELSKLGHEITGIEHSMSGVLQANNSFPKLRIEQGSAYDDLYGKYGKFQIALSIEVVEHLYFPRQFAARAFESLESGGWIVLTTPYHGYWKNLALAVTGKMDSHFTALWDGGHIKFWSIQTLRALLVEAGFIDIQFRRVGRIQPLAKSMIAVARRP